MKTWTETLTLAALAAVLALAACTSGDEVGMAPETEVGMTPETEPVYVSARELSRYGERFPRYNAERKAAMSEMDRMPPDEFGPFMRRNGWKEKWPDLWGANGIFRMSVSLRPPEVMTPEQHARLDRMLETFVADGVRWSIRGPGVIAGRKPTLYESITAAGAEMGDGVVSRSEADEFKRRVVEIYDRRVSDYIEAHARRWVAK